MSSAGDFNGDGYDDIIIGARGSDDGDTNSGDAYVIFGKSGGFTNIDLGTFGPGDGFEHPWRGRKRPGGNQRLLRGRHQR